MWWVFLLWGWNSEALAEARMKRCIGFLQSTASLVFISRERVLEEFSYAQCVWTWKKKAAWFSTCNKTITETQIYLKKNTLKNTFYLLSFFTAAAETVQPVHHHCVKDSLGMSNWLTFSVVFPQRSTKRQYTVWICSQGQEGKLLAATQNHSKCWYVLHFISDSGPGTEQTTRRKGIRTKLRWAEGEIVSSAKEHELLHAVAYMTETKAGNDRQPWLRCEKAMTCSALFFDVF